MTFLSGLLLGATGVGPRRMIYTTASTTTLILHPLTQGSNVRMSNPPLFFYVLRSLTSF